MAVDDAACQRALSDLISATTRANFEISRAGAAEVETAAAITTPIGLHVYEHGEGRVDEPGELLHSFHIDGPQALGSTMASTKVGPTAIFSRQRELGGPIYPRNMGLLHWMDPDLTNPDVFARSVEQEGSHYLLKAVEIIKPVYRATAARLWGAAIGRRR